MVPWEFRDTLSALDWHGIVARDGFNAEQSCDIWLRLGLPGPPPERLQLYLSKEDAEAIERSFQ